MNIIVEVGSNSGTDTENFLRDTNNFVFAFEQKPQLYNELLNKFKNYTNIKVFDYAIDTEVCNIIPDNVNKEADIHFKKL